MSDWENYRYFLAVARSGTLSGAARLLKVDHATVSRRLALLEGELGAKLVDRLPRACRLTAVGQQALISVAAMEDASDSVVRTARASREPLAGRVTVSAPPVLVTHLLAPHLAVFRSHFPDIRLSFTTEAEQMSLSRHEADIAIGTTPPREGSNVARKVGRLTFGLYMSKDYPLQATPDSWQFIAYGKDFSELPQQKWLLGIAGNRPIACELNDINGHLIAVRTGIGVAGLPHFIGDAGHDLIQITRDIPPFSRDIWIRVHRDLRNMPPVRAATEFLASIVATLRQKTP